MKSDFFMAKTTKFTDLYEVVYDDCVPEVEGLPVLHDSGPEELDAVEVEAADGHGGQGRVHQGPVINPS